MMRINAILSVFWITLFFSGSPASAAPADAKEDVRVRLERVLKDTKTMTWDQKIWLGKGNEEERTTAKCYWKAPDVFRLNVSEGRGKGATVIFKDGKITAFQRGLLSFAKLSYKPRDKTVLSLRGGDITQNGFLDDLGYVLRQWEKVLLTSSDAEWIVEYTDHQGLPATMKIRQAELYPYRIEVMESGKLVEIHNYSNVSYNAPIDPSVFNP
jgi:outer membrane lipoprotein-sorting protein